ERHDDQRGAGRRNKSRGRTLERRESSDPNTEGPTAHSIPRALRGMVRLKPVPDPLKAGGAEPRVIPQKEREGSTSFGRTLSYWRLLRALSVKPAMLAVPLAQLPIFGGFAPCDLMAAPPQLRVVSDKDARPLSDAELVVRLRDGKH